jgi:hypothetical protein
MRRIIAFDEGVKWVVAVGAGGAVVPSLAGLVPAFPFTPHLRARLSHAAPFGLGCDGSGRIVAGNSVLVCGKPLRGMGGGGYLQCR